MNEKVQIQSYIPRELVFKLDQEYHRLHQILIKGQKIGQIPKSKKITPSIVKRVVWKLGLDELERMTFEEFGKVSRQIE